MWKTLSKKRKVALIIFSITLVAILLFIWINSCLPPEVSSKESDGVYGVVTEIIDGVFGEGTTEKVVSKGDIRKLAHATEFFMLSLNVCLILYVTFNFKLKTIWIPFAFTLIVAVIDEILQNFSGRACMFTDILIDTLGGVIALICFTTIFYIVQAIKKPKSKTA